MAVEILDGTIEASEPARLKRGYGMFDPLKFRGRDGTERILRKVCTGGDVTDALRKGGAGRFYVSSGGGQTGIHGVRLEDGTTSYAHYNNMELVTLIGAFAGGGTLVLGMLTGDIMITPVIIGTFLGVAYFYFRSIRLAGKQQYDADVARA
jgi:hypothetical protein